MIRFVACITASFWAAGRGGRESVDRSISGNTMPCRYSFGSMIVDFAANVSSGDGESVVRRGSLRSDLARRIPGIVRR